MWGGGGACVVKGGGGGGEGGEREGGGGKQPSARAMSLCPLRPTSFFKRLQLIRLGHRGAEAAA